MPEPDRYNERAIRETAYFIWEREGCPEGRARDHWARAIADAAVTAFERDDEPMEDEEKVLAGLPDANFPALLTRDVAGG
jgi:hypothetical protein